ncbi:MAG: hypothetical protein GTN76_03070 [Candidatus Aenigmarchaeota archaeon]|nr:hypothetical protein [Candidatus Aenigmarchaeota archaeon]
MKKENRTDPVCGMKGHIKKHGHYFCSQHCIEKYEKEHGIKGKKEECETCAKPAKKWYKERLYLISLVIGAILVISYFIQPFRPLTMAFIDYVALIWWALLLGFLLGGFIDHFIPSEYIRRYLTRHKKRTVLYSVVFGFLMSACSHGILAIAMELYKKGASTPAVIAFLLASPWANLPVTILLFGFFGINAFYIVISAIIIAIITGLIYQVLDRRGWVECKYCETKIDESFSVWADLKKRMKKYKLTNDNLKNDFKGVMKGSWSLTKMVMWWIVIGMFMASFARAFIPHEWFILYLGPTIIGLVVTLILATVIEVCSEGSAPLAFEIFDQSGAFGNAFVFLSAGVSTDYTEIGLIWSNIGKRAAILLPIITVPQILLLGWLFNIFL